MRPALSAKAVPFHATLEALARCIGGDVYVLAGHKVACAQSSANWKQRVWRHLELHLHERTLRITTAHPLRITASTAGPGSYSHAQRSQGTAFRMYNPAPTRTPAWP